MNPIRVLLVDDNVAFLKAAATFLNSLPGVQVVGCATCASEGLEQAEVLQPDLVLMDVNMPGMSGFEAVRLIKQGAAPPKTVLVTFLDEETYQAIVKSTCADGFVSKSNFVTEIPPLLDSLFPVRETVRALRA